MEQYEIKWKDYYKSLQLDPNAEQEIIKVAYGKLAQIYHPDKNPDPGASQKMAEINEAYCYLSDPPKRVKYNELYWKHQKVKDQAQEKPVPNISPSSLDLGEISLGKTHIIKFTAENLGAVVKEENVLDYWPKVRWIRVRTDSPYLPCEIIVEIDTFQLKPEANYKGEVDLILDGVQAKAGFAFRTLSLMLSLKHLFGSSLR